MGRDIPKVGLDVDVTRGDGCLELVVAGELDIASSDVLLSHLDEVDTLLRVVLDLRDVDFMDSTGLRCLWLARARVRSVGGEIALRSPSHAVLRVLEAMDLVDQFVVVD